MNHHPAKRFCSAAHLGSLLGACLLAAFVLAPGQALAVEPAQVLLHHGERFLRMGNTGFAKANYEKLIAHYEGTPEAAEAHGDLGVIAARDGNDDLAVTEYAKAISGGFELAHFNLGQALLRKLDNGGGQDLKERALAEFLAFQAYLQSGRPRPAILTYSLPEVQAELDAALKRLQ